MRCIWTENDIVEGLYIIKESSPKGSGNLDFARTVAFKIGWCGTGVDKYGRISINDGMFIPIGTKAELAEHFNKDKVGYRPLTKEEFIRFIEYSEQGFY